MTKGRLVLALCAIAAPAAAGPFDAPSAEQLGARAAGMGGFEVAGDQNLEALFYNPAGLPAGDVQAGVFGAMDGTRRGQAAFGLSAPVDDSLRLGFYYDQLMDDGINALESGTLALVAASEIQPGVSLGLRADLHQLRTPALPQSVRGADLDVGWQDRALRAPWLPGYWCLGLSADNLAGIWSDQDEASALPMVGSIGFAYSPRPGLSFGEQVDWTSADDLARGVSQSWRSGLQWDLSRPLALRAGWSDQDGQGQAGIGISLKAAQPAGAGLDYALAYTPASMAFSHRLALHWAWAPGSRAEIRVQIKQVLLDPDSGVIRNALVEVELSPLLRAKPWHVALKDGQGRVWRTLTPLDLQDRSLIWDGRDDQGRLRPPPAGLRAELVAMGATGPRNVAASGTLSQVPRLQELAQAQQAPATQEAASGLAAPSVRPVFDDATGDALSRVTIDLPAAAARSWSLEILDGRGRSLRTLAGLGVLPHTLVWDGRDDRGRKVDDVLGAQLKLRVESPQGRLAARIQPLFSQQAFVLARREALQSPELQLASLELPLLLARPPLSWLDTFMLILSSRANERLGAQDLRQRRKDAQDRLRLYLRETGKAVEVDLFDPEKSAVLAGRQDLLDLVERRLDDGGMGRGTLWVTGMARSDEKLPQALARRRAEAVAKRLMGHNKSLPVVLDSMGKVGDFKGVRLEFR